MTLSTLTIVNKARFVIHFSQNKIRLFLFPEHAKQTKQILDYSWPVMENELELSREICPTLKILKKFI